MDEFIQCNKARQPFTVCTSHIISIMYITILGPNKASVCDMWRMVWQENTVAIVMLTNLQEGVKVIQASLPNYLL